MNSGGARPPRDETDREDTLPLFPRDRGYDFFIASLVFEVVMVGVLAILPFPNSVISILGCVVLVSSFGLATLPFFIYTREPWLTRLRYAFTGCMMWALFTFTAVLLTSFVILRVVGPPW